MKINRVLLIKPAYQDSYYKYNDLPAGLGYISQALEDNNIEHIVYDMHLEKKLSMLLKTIAQFSPELIGLSLMSYRFMKHYDLIECIKTEFPRIRVVVGGPHVSTFREEVLNKCRYIDFGVVLEGDRTIIELCNNIDNPSLVKGLLYRKNGNVRFTGDRLFIEDLDRVGFPKYTHFDLEKYEFVTIISSRGCPFRCIYCPVIYTIGNKWRCRSAVSVVDELEYWHTKGLRRFEFGDDNFTLRNERVIEICDEIERRNLTGLKIGLGNGIRADKVDQPLLKRMKEVGFSYVAFGVESASNKVLKALKKGETIETIEEAIKAACEVGLPVELFFLLGAPTETEQDVEESVRFALKYPVRDVAFYNILPFPNTELYNELLEKGAFVKDPQSHLNDSSHWLYTPVFETPGLSRDDRIRLLKWANGVTKKHTDKVKDSHKIQRLKAVGIPNIVAVLITNLAKVELIKKPFRKLGILKRFKDFCEIKY
ncbi:MAG: B12-binding domain-containing radical SAM protein [Planctomycetota bacterium]|jgi:radical SAM superfamily enzyme YgiQ (UPF0313 family)